MQHHNDYYHIFDSVSQSFSSPCFVALDHQLYIVLWKKVDIVSYWVSLLVF